MEEELSKILFNPVVGRIATIIIGIAIIWMVVKTIQRNLFGRIKDNSSRYKARKLSSFIGYLLTYRYTHYGGV